MSVTVRSLTSDERRALAALLNELQAHVEACRSCSLVMGWNRADPRMCAAGLALFRRWEAWRGAPTAEVAKDHAWARAHGVPIQCPDELEGRPCSCKPPRPS